MTDPAAPQVPRVSSPPTGKDEEPKKSGGWCSMLLVLLLGTLALVVVVGASIGFALMGGVADEPFHTLPPPIVTEAPTFTPSPSGT